MEVVNTRPDGDNDDPGLTRMLTEESQQRRLRRSIIALSASANKHSKIKERADEYTTLIMEELDPTHLGYIEERTMSVPGVWIKIN
ncbi:hypothetical protein E2562_024036 [Oryza meyeriana var. granulata]|uniref:Uncharacterized protein n=1 Tax=Oryza meyeriana var. granulata TaxID=110450 RepID=A0A6G1CT39_9ORYZ|nr:hypothetical protein E2562_024036 [Oryza meyeriana var. granulata]